VEQLAIKVMVRTAWTGEVEVVVVVAILRLNGRSRAVMVDLEL
jgi:hypothetical protein